MTDFLKPFETYITDTYYGKPSFNPQYEHLLFTRKFFGVHNRNLAELFSLVSEKHGITPIIYDDSSTILCSIFRMVFWKFTERPDQRLRSEHKTDANTILIKYRKDLRGKLAISPPENNFDETDYWNNSLVFVSSDFKDKNRFFSKDFLDRFIGKLSGATLGDRDMNPIMKFPVAKTPTEMLMKLKLNGTGLI